MAPSPKTPLSLQYYEMHRFRIANLSLFPSAELRTRVNASWGPKGKNWSVTGNVRYRDSENDELDFTNWKQNDYGAGANFMISAGPRLLFNVGVDHWTQETDAESIIPLMDG